MDDSERQHESTSGEPEERIDSSNKVLRVSRKNGKNTTGTQQPTPQITLDDWQVQALNHDGNLLLKTGRQVGKTTIMAIKAAKYMITHPNHHIIVCSLTEDQAQLIIVMTLDYLERNYKTFIAKGTKKPTKNKIQLTNKSSILARPVGNTGDAVRGFTGDVLILDEAAKFNEFIFASSKPTLLTTGGQIWMCSTPFGKQGYFYECYKNESGRFKVIEINSWDVVNTRPITELWTEERKQQSIKFLEDEKKDMSRLQFAQEYLGLFVEDLTQFFSDEWINKVCTAQMRTTPILQGKQYYLGLDIARMGEDQTTFEVLDKINPECIEHIYSQTTKKTLTTTTYDTILLLDSLYHFRQIGIDAGSGSLGVGILDFLLRSPVKRRVEPLNNLTRPLNYRGDKKKTLFKVDMYQNLLAMGERRVIKLLDDDDVRLSLKSVQYEYETKEGELTKVRIFGNYTHIAEGLIRAAWLANQKSLNHTISFI